MEEQKKEFQNGPEEQERRGPQEKQTPEGLPEDAGTKDWLRQCDRFKWRDNPPKVLRGDMREAFRAGAAAEEMKCDCWNVKCPFFGNCRKCIVFHKALYQLPTFQRHMMSELYLAGYLDDEFHITDEERAAEREV